MAKAQNKTQATKADAAAFIATIEPPQRREDAAALLDLFKRVTGLEPVMWGAAIIGYGRYHYKYDSGREGDSMLTGFSPRKANLVMYIMPGYQLGEIEDMLARLGQHKLGKSCLYIKKLSDIDLDVLEEIVRAGLVHMRDKYETWDA